ncbi:hypothetical protein Tco_1499010 [Tanacetum coccineum]
MTTPRSLNRLSASSRIELYEHYSQSDHDLELGASGPNQMQQIQGKSHKIFQDLKNQNSDLVTVGRYHCNLLQKGNYRAFIRDDQVPSTLHSISGNGYSLKDKIKPKLTKPSTGMERS